MFDKVEVKDIGRISDSIVLGGLVFGMGMTWVCFQALGTVPSLIDWLNMPHIGGASHGEKISQDPVGDVVWARGFL
jgi:hypothetical protein